MMTLEEHDVKVRPHLIFIEAGAEMAVRHARALPFKMPFTTHAQDELAEARKVLENALASIVQAQALYESKELESES